MSNVAFRNFAGGEIAPSLYGRTDLVKYLTSVRTMRNFIAQRHGGTATRSGTELVAEVKDSDLRARLIRFVSSDVGTDVFVLEFGEKYIRLHQNGAPVSVTGVAWADATAYAAGTVVSFGGTNYYARFAHTSALDTKPGVGSHWQTDWYALETNILEIPSPYLTVDLPEIQYVQVQKTMTLTHVLYPTQELVRLTNGDWTISPVVFGPSVAPPTNFNASGGAATGTTYWAVTAVNQITGEESLAAVKSLALVPTSGSPTTLSWALVQGFTVYNIYRSTDGVTFGFVASTTGGGIAPFIRTTWVTDNASVGTLVGSPNWVQSAAQSRMQVLTVITDKASDGKYTVKGTITIVATGADGTGVVTSGRIRMFYSRGAETRVDAGIAAILDSMSGLGTMGPLEFTAVVSVPDNGYSNLVIDLVPEVLCTNPNALSITCVCLSNEDSPPNNSISWGKGGTGYVDTGTTADMTVSPPKDTPYFKAPGDYPGSVGRYQQRQIFGRTINQPGWVWASRVASPKNFAAETPPQPNSPIAFEMDGKKSITIKHFLDLARLAVFTSSEEKVIEGENQSGIIKPDAINVRSHSYNGANFLSPLVVNNIALYMQARGNQVRLLKYDNIQESIGADLTLLATHLFRQRTIVDWDFALTPDNLTWAVRSDGTLLGMTFLTDQDVWGWHRHDTDGLFENVCVVPEGIEDRLYVVVNRGGVRTIERMAVAGVTDVRDLHYMDCGVKAFDGRNTDLDNEVYLSDSASWETEELVTLTAAKTGTFTAGDIGTTLLIISEGGDRVYVNVTVFTSDKVLRGYPETVISWSLMDIPTANWARCVDSVNGLDHLDGKNVAVVADGYLLASPNNPEYELIDVADGSIDFDRPYSVVRVGLPYVCDLVTLDIDLPASTVKSKKRLVSKVMLFLENSADVWIGLPNQPTEDNLINGLDQIKLREEEQYADPLSLVTDDRTIPIQSEHNSNGRVLIRQVDPLPVTILAIAPIFAEE